MSEVSHLEIQHVTTEDLQKILAMNRTLIIAEAGVNHNGSMDLARKLIDAAADAGADFVKFQTFKAELLVSPLAAKAHYQIANNAGQSENQLGMLKELELSFSQFRELKNYCSEKGIGFLSTAFDIESCDFLISLGIPIFKIPSGEITNKPLLQTVGVKADRIILSTGMATLKEVAEALAVLEKAGAKRNRITVLHCTTEYPAPLAEVNLKAIQTIRNKLQVSTGYSDHTIGIAVPIAAVALGAVVIEKHFTLDRTMPGPDHAASLEPEELKEMVQAIRNVDLALSGNGCKEPSPSELKNIKVARKSLHFANTLPAGHTLSGNDLIALRPADGISPMDIDSFIGRKLIAEVQAGEQVKASQFL